MAFPGFVSSGCPLPHLPPSSSSSVSSSSSNSSFLRSSVGRSNTVSVPVPFSRRYVSRPCVRRAPTMTTSASTPRPMVHVGDVTSRLGDMVREKSAAAIAARGKFTVAISGGSLPKLLAQGLDGVDVDFSKWVVCLADERIVPLNDADSNYGSIKSFFPGMDIVPIDPTLPPAECATHYQAAVTSALRSAATPTFDAILLGLGPDGHTCSLFPDHPLLSVTDRVVAHIEDSPKPPPQRVTLTLPVVNAASSVIFVCTGAGKAPVVKDIFENPNSTLPGALVRPTSGLCDWLLDEGAASQLSSSS